MTILSKMLKRYLYALLAIVGLSVISYGVLIACGMGDVGFAACFMTWLQLLLGCGAVLGALFAPVALGEGVIRMFPEENGQP